MEVGSERQRFRRHCASNGYIFRSCARRPASNGWGGNNDQRNFIGLSSRPRFYAGGVKSSIIWPSGSRRNTCHAPSGRDFLGAKSAPTSFKCRSHGSRSSTLRAKWLFFWLGKKSERRLP